MRKKRDLKSSFVLTARNQNLKKTFSKNNSEACQTFLKEADDHLGFKAKKRPCNFKRFEEKVVSGHYTQGQYAQSGHRTQCPCA